MTELLSFQVHYQPTDAEGKFKQRTEIYFNSDDPTRLVECIPTIMKKSLQEGQVLNFELRSDKSISVIKAQGCLP